MACLMLFVYRVLAWIALAPLCLFVRNHPNFKGTLASRLGISLPIRPAGDLIWLHCASLGEVRAAELLIEALKKIRPRLMIFVSSMTATGREAALKIPGIDHVFPFPFDLVPVIRRYIRHLKPSVLVIMETEIWPNLLLEAKISGLPVVFANARMSGKSVRNYRFIKPLTSKILSDSSVLAISETDGERFSSIGARHVKVIGNIKFDAVKSADVFKKITLKKDMNALGRKVFIAGSVREGEEKFVVDAIKSASSAIPGLLSIIAPRHPDRVELLCETLKNAGLPYSLRSSRNPSDIVIVDTMGELFSLYGASDVAFVGGSLVDLGGQNILEPIAWEVPTIHGQYMSNFNWALDVVGQWTIKVENPENLGTVIFDIFDNLDRYREIAGRALLSISKFKGISMQYAEEIAFLAAKQQVAV
jgi:3-deoxy-D-manno-octulosonic-acid transferase